MNSNAQLEKPKNFYLFYSCSTEINSNKVTCLTFFFLFPRSKTYFLGAFQSHSLAKPTDMQIIF